MLHQHLSIYLGCILSLCLPIASLARGLLLQLFMLLTRAKLRKKYSWVSMVKFQATKPAMNYCENIYVKGLDIASKFTFYTAILKL